MTTIIEQLTEIMTTTPKEEATSLKEVIEEIKVKRPVGRPRKYRDYEDLLACMRNQYHEDPTEKIKYVKQYYKDNKDRLAIKRHERYLRDKKEVMTTTPTEEATYLNEVIEEIKVKRPIGRPRIFTAEEVIERRKACDKRRYDRDPQKKVEANRIYRRNKKASLL
jgi:hypothetical protein